MSRARIRISSGRAPAAGPGADGRVSNSRSRTPLREVSRLGTIELAIPKLRQGSYFRSLLEPRRRHDRALLAVVQEAYVHGVSTRNVDALAQALGLNGISKDQVSRDAVMVGTVLGTGGSMYREARGSSG
jgi:transposase-like protein